MSTVDKKNVSNAIQLPDFSKWEEEQVGFAPYWSPEPEKWFLAQVVSIDKRDPEFVRYLMKASIDTACKRGPVDESEDVIVKSGEYFTISVYYSLQYLFDTYLEMGCTPVMRVTAVKEVKTKNSQTCWTWKVQVSPEDKKMLTKKRVEASKYMEAKKAKELNEENDAFPPS